MGISIFNSVNGEYSIIDTTDTLRAYTSSGTK